MDDCLYKIRDLQIKSFSTFGEKVILDGVSLSIQNGEILGLIGNTGGGKSMLGFALLEMLPLGCYQGALLSNK